MFHFKFKVLDYSQTIKSITVLTVTAHTVQRYIQDVLFRNHSMEALSTSVCIWFTYKSFSSFTLLWNKSSSSVKIHLNHHQQGMKRPWRKRMGVLLVWHGLIKTSFYCITEYAVVLEAKVIGSYLWRSSPSVTMVEKKTTVLILFTSASITLCFSCSCLICSSIS